MLEQALITAVETHKTATLGQRVSCAAAHTCITVPLLLADPAGSTLTTITESHLSLIAFHL